MALKPSISPPIIANLLKYAAIPLVPVPLQGTDTKTEPDSDRVNNGNIGNVPPWATDDNYLKNLYSLWGEWAFQGRGIAQDDTHIQETDENGIVVAVGGEFGNFDVVTTLALRVRPNKGALSAGMLVSTINSAAVSGALFEDLATGGNRRALEIRCDGESSVAPFYINTAYDAGGGSGTRAAIQIDADNTSSVGAVEIDVQRGTAIKIRSTGTMLGPAGIDVALGDSSACIYAKQLSGKAPAARFESVDGGSDASAPIILVPQAFGLDGDGAQSGSIWVHKHNDIVDHFAIQTYVGNSTRHVVHTRNAWCYAETITADDDQTLTDDDANTWTTMASVQFPDDMVPHSVSNLVVTVHGEVKRLEQAATVTSISGLDVEVLDTTNFGSPPQEDNDRALYKNVDLVPLATGNANNTLFRQFVLTQWYTIPAPGKTTFILRIKTKDGEPAGQRLSVRRLRLIIQARP